MNPHTGEAKRPVMIRVDRGQWEAVREFAKGDGVSMAEYVRRLIKRSVAQRQRGEGDG